MYKKNLLLLFLIISLIRDLSGAIYYVAPFGNDSHTKNQAQLSSSPWKTIAKAAQIVQAGDTILLADGKYSEGMITFAHSGSPSKWIMLTAIPGKRPIITNEKESMGIFIHKRSFIHISGLTLCGYNQDGIGIFYSDYVICTNIHAYNNGNAGINSVDSDHIIIQNSELHHNGWNSEGDSGWGDGASVNNHYAVGKTSIFRRNVCYANWQKRKDHYWDGNGFTLDCAGAGGLHIVANNVFYNNGGAGLLAASTENVKLFHNIFFRNMSDPECSNKAELYLAKNEIHNTVLKNNIIYSRSGIWTINRYGGEDNTIIEKNLIWGEDGINTQIWWLNFEKVNLDYWIKNRASQTIIGNPRFLSTPFDNNIKTFHNSTWIAMEASQYNFELQSNSHCIDAGTFLTRTVSSGFGNEVELKDAGYFTDGFGQINGDYIKIGKNNPVRIIRIDYEANVITVAADAGIRWNKADPVHIPYYGSAPDIGAYEFNPELPPSSILNLSQPSPAKPGRIEITLITSKTVIKNPSPLFFIDSDSSITRIELTGALPGASFSGKLGIDGTYAEGTGYFILESNSLVDEYGNRGNEITQGKYFRIDKTAPNIPQNIGIDKH